MSFGWPQMAGRGGKRAGAGARHKLDEFEQITVAAEYNRRWTELVAASIATARASVLGASDYEYRTEQVRAALAYSGAKYFKSEESDELTGDVESALFDAARRMGLEAEYPKGCEGEIPAPRVFRFAGARPYGESDALLRDVAVWASELLGRTVTPRQVRSCRDLARSVANESLPKP